MPTHDSVLTLELPYRERLELWRTSFDGGRGPKVAVAAESTATSWRACTSVIDWRC